MFRCALCLLLLLVGHPALGRTVGLNSNVVAVVQIRESRQDQAFDIVGDELYVRQGDGDWRLQSIEPKPTTELLRAEASRLTGAGTEARLVLYESGKDRSRVTRRILTPEVLVIHSAEAGAKALKAPSADSRFKPLPMAANGMSLFEAVDPTGALDLATRLKAVPGVMRVEPQLGRFYETEFIPDDPRFAAQWHLDVQADVNSPFGSFDINVVETWDVYRGAGITIGVIDSGIETAHPDLAANMLVNLGYDYLRNVQDSNPQSTASTESHGTAVAGLAAAVGNNGIGVAGVAFEAKIAPFRLITGVAVTDSQVANAFLHSNAVIHIKNNSWGAGTRGTNINAPSSFLQAVIDVGVQAGRGGKGTIMVFSSGNDGDTLDNVNYNMQKTSISSIPVAAANAAGTVASYSTPGAAIVVASPSGDFTNQRLVTTDRVGTNGYNVFAPSANPNATANYATDFSGTSGSAPIASGVIALMLQANPGLGWRDVQEILIRSARRQGVGSNSADWQTNSAGLAFNHSLGAGLIDASNAVRMALSWTNLPVATSRQQSFPALIKNIPDNTANGITNTVTFSGAPLRVEHARIRMDVTHPRRGDLEIVLVSPGGMRSRLAEKHNDPGANWPDWIFMSRRHWGELSTGTWKLEVRDLQTGNTGLINWLEIELLGVSATGSQIAGSSFSEAAGASNGNGTVEPGETLEESLSVLNTGSADLVGATATISGPAGIAFLRSSTTFPTIPSGQTGVVSQPFSYKIAKTTPCGTLLSFTQVVTTAGSQLTNIVNRLLGGVSQTNVWIGGNSGLFIPDQQTVFATNVISLPSSPVIESVTAAIRLDHTTVVDLVIGLQHPDGTEVVLFNHRSGNTNDLGTGTCGVNDSKVLFSDAASQPIADIGFPHVGSFRPEDPLAGFYGKPANGNWRLRLSDEYSNDVGTLRCWTITTVTRGVSGSCTVYNIGPSATNVSVSTQSGVAVNGALLGADGDGDAITFVRTGNPANGTVTAFNASSGAFTYAPNAGFSGTDSFTYVANDGFTNSATVTVTLSVAGDDSPFRFTTFSKPPGGPFSLTLTGSVNRPYILEASTNLANWVAIQTNTPASSPFTLNDPAATNLPVRFYRLKR